MPFFYIKIQKIRHATVSKTIKGITENAARQKTAEYRAGLQERTKEKDRQNQAYNPKVRKKARIFRSPSPNAPGVSCQR